MDKKLTIDEVLGKERKMHWKFIGYDKTVISKNEQGIKVTHFIFPTEITVNHFKTEAEALAGARKGLKRKEFYLKEAWECTQCQSIEEQREMMKMLKKHIE